MDDSTSQALAHRDDEDSTHLTNTSRVRTGRVRQGNIPFGLNSLDADAREAFGHELRVFMSFKDGSARPSASDGPQKALPDAPVAIARRLKQLGQDITSGTADQLELLVRFDELQGWTSSGARHCVAWMNLELGISPQLGWEYLRVGRRLRGLPLTRALFRAGRLTWSVIRLLSRVADEENEALLCHTALDASVSEVERFCRDYHWQRDSEENRSQSENERSLRQIKTRALTWTTQSNGNTRITLALPPEVAHAFLNSVEHSLAQLDAPADTEASLPQRRADAAVLMAERSLQNAGRDVATADRYQVIVSVEASTLRQHAQTESDQPIHSMATAIPTSTATPTHTHPPAHIHPPTVSSTSIPTDAPTPARRPTLPGSEPIATETARRIACDCSLSAITHSYNGEPIDIGRKSRLWPPAMARAIRHRDQHCQYPGCSQTRHLQIHHIRHWADGGSTRVDNGVSVCAHHHTVVHEGGYTMERVCQQENGLDEQFQRQQATPQITNESEKRLRNSPESFEQVRRLSPTRFRFRVVNRAGEDIRDVDGTADRPDNRNTENTQAERQNTHAVRPCYDQWLANFQKLVATDFPGVAEVAELYSVG